MSDVTRWSPDDSSIDPHEFDYKIRVVESFREHLREEILTEADKPRSTRFDLEELAENVEYVRYSDSEAKQGMFIQASGLITDGDEDATPKHILASLRSNNQFHDPRLERHIAGASVLFGTLFHPLELIRGNPALSAAILNSLDYDGRFALFGRKLLLPTDFVTSAFLGIGFNFQNTAKEYVHFVWHVRVRTRPKVHLVAERDAKKHDVPEWYKIKKLPSDFTHAPIDRAVLQACGYTRKTKTAPQAGFLYCPKFEGSKKTPRYKAFSRDTVMHDLLLLLQEAIHYGELAFDEGVKEEEFRDEAERFLRRKGDHHLRHLQTRAEPREGIGPHSGRGDLVVEFANSKGRREQYRYLLEFKVQNGLDRSGEHRKQLLEYASRSRHPRYDAYYLVRGIRDPQSTAALHGLSPVLDEPPMFQLDCALQPVPPSAKVPIKHVSHGIMLATTGKSGDYYVLFTRQPHDECMRLPGGKMDAKKRSHMLEHPSAALTRELEEELSLTAERHFTLAQIFPKGERHLGGLPGLLSIEVSPSTHQTTPYRLYPYLVHLTEEGRQTILRQLGKPSHFPRFVSMQEWLANGLGFDPAYARIIDKHLSSEDKRAAAIRVTSKHLQVGRHM